MQKSINPHSKDIDDTVAQITDALHGKKLSVTLTALTTCIGYGLMPLPQKDREKAIGFLTVMLDEILKIYDTAKKSRQ